MKTDDLIEVQALSDFWKIVSIDTPSDLENVVLFLKLPELSSGISSENERGNTFPGCAKLAFLEFKGQKYPLSLGLQKIVVYEAIINAIIRHIFLEMTP